MTHQVSEMENSIAAGALLHNHLYDIVRITYEQMKIILLQNLELGQRKLTM